jgi:predicted lipoprotein with Yx(FWY)xxD motif
MFKKMEVLIVKVKRMTAFLVVVPLLLLVLGAFQTVDAAPLKVMVHGEHSYLADSNGRTLYYYLKDMDGKATCVGPCVVRWPIFYTENIMVPAGVDAKEFGVITHPNGQKQNTFRGWPLYYWMADKMPGDMDGQGRNGVWFYVLNPGSN